MFAAFYKTFQVCRVWFSCSDCMYCGSKHVMKAGGHMV
jgi:hypothetical protein